MEASAAWLKRLVDAEIYAVLMDGLDIAARRRSQATKVLISDCARVDTRSAVTLSQLSLTFGDR